MTVRRLEVSGIDAVTGAGVYYGAALTEATECQASDVFVVGGANSAGQAAMLLSRYANKVTLIVRSHSLSTSMSHYLINRIDAAENVEVLTLAQVLEVKGTDRLETITISVGNPVEQRTLPATAMFIFIGTAPRSDIVAGVVEHDDRGFILTGPDLMREGRRPKGWTPNRDPFILETSVPGIFAVGDIRHNSIKRVASAVGEGSAAVGMIHKYLETV